MDNKPAIEQMKIELCTKIRDEIIRHGWTQAVAAKRLGCRQPRVSLLMQVNVSLFSLNSLTDMVLRLGGKVTHIVEFPHDRT